MPKPLVGVTVDPPLDAVKQRFAERKKRIADKSIPYRQASIYLDRWVQENFKSEGGKVGGWAPFKHGGRVMRGGRIDTSAKLLQDTGRLRMSFIPWAERDDAGIGSDLEYSQYHYDPAHPRRGGALPVRRTLPVKKEVARDIREIFVEHLKNSLKDARNIFRRITR